MCNKCMPTRLEDSFLQMFSTESFSYFYKIIHITILYLYLIYVVIVSDTWHYLFGTRLAGQAFRYQLVPVRSHHQFHRNGHLVVRLPTIHP